MRSLRESAKRRNAGRRYSRALLRLLLWIIRWRQRTLQGYRLEKLQDLVPLALVFEHDLAEETNGRHAVAEQLVVEFLQ